MIVLLLCVLHTPSNVLLQALMCDQSKYQNLIILIYHRSDYFGDDKVPCNNYIQCKHAFCIIIVSQVIKCPL